MTPSVLAAVLLLSVSARAQTSTCLFDTPKHAISADSAECRTLQKISEDYGRLVAAAGFGKDELKLNRVVEPSPEFNAYYTAGSHDVTVNLGFVSCVAAHAEIGPVVLAHEIGHAVQDREGIRRRGGLIGANAKGRRFESQADRIGIDLLQHAGYRIDDAAVTAQIKTACLGSQSPQFVSKDDHPGQDARVIEAMRAQAAQQRGVAAKLPGMIRGFGAPADAAAGPTAAPAAAVDVAAKTPLAERHGYSLTADRYQPAVPLSQFNAQGGVKGEKGLKISNDIPEPPTTLAAKGRKVELAPGVTWTIPRKVLANFSPDEIIAAVARSKFPSLSDMKADVEAGLAYIITNKYWNLLPGRVTAKDAPPAGAPAPLPQ